ncbi:MAG TPA: response regulator [Pirellulales bacterium]|nr:response regulator [Pirellulales bacterium]
MNFACELTHESTLADLPLDDFAVEPATPGEVVAAAFEEHLELPGVIVVARDRVIGMISREKFLERLSRPYGLELYMRRPIKSMLDSIDLGHLELAGHYGIHEAASIALNRPVEQVYEPIVVVLPGARLRLLSIYILLQAQSQLLALANETIRRQKELADEANSAKSRFLANMSHEIRTPMNGILAMAELLLESEMASEQREYLEIINTSAESLLTVINDILDFSKIEAGKLELDCHPFTLRDSLADMVKPLSLLAHAKGLELACHVERDVPDRLLGDAGRLRQIIVNLAGNAIKFTESGEVAVHVSRLEPRDDKTLVQITVRDTGIGIPFDRQKSVFQPFEQADGSTTRKYGGTGLGLAITKRLVELMGGHVWLESDVGQGSRFHFTACLSGLPALADDKRVGWPGERVLLVDDNRTARLGLTNLLEDWQLKVTAVDGPAAAQKARGAVGGEPFSLIVVDSILPSQNGVSLAEQLVHEADGGALPCIILTSPGHPDSPGRSPTLQRVAYVAKPVKPSDLERAIDAVLDGSSAATLVPAGAADEQVALQPLAVLLAEDGLVNQTVARRLLERNGHTVTVVGDGREALKALAGNSFDIVLMDIQMPELDGLAATAEIRRGERGSDRHVPVIAMTAHAMKGDRERCLAAGMDGYVSKPIRSRELLAAIAEALSLGSTSGAQSLAASHPVQTRTREGMPRFDSAEKPAPVLLGGPVIDWERTLDQAANDRELVLEMIGVYFDELPNLLARIAQGIEANDGPELRRAAHTLKGALHHLAAERAATAAAELETKGSSGRAVDGRGAYQTLCSELSLLEPELLDFQASPAADTH